DHDLARDRDPDRTADIANRREQPRSRPKLRLFDPADRHDRQGNDHQRLANAPHDE
ncbi:hypothetical protein chiPu_0032616, partial [Chiloscyllium punctatum]|nr:hypothetical protein [Chiloscyllium punctatum]